MSFVILSNNLGNYLITVRGRADSSCVALRIYSLECRHKEKNTFHRIFLGRMLFSGIADERLAISFCSFVSRDVLDVLL